MRKKIDRRTFDYRKSAAINSISFMIKLLSLYYFFLEQDQ